MILKKLVFDELEIRGFFIFQLLVVFPAPLILLQCRIQDCIGSCYLCIDNYYSNIGNCPYLMKITALLYRAKEQNLSCSFKHLHSSSCTNGSIRIRFVLIAFHFIEKNKVNYSRYFSLMFHYKDLIKQIICTASLLTLQSKK